MLRDKTVLIVDDEPNIRGFLAMVLEDEGYTVETASDGCEALSKARDCSPHAILSALLIPVPDGVGFPREWGANPALGSVPILLMSVEGTSVQAETLSAQAVLRKPFDLDVLLRRLGALLP